MIAKMIDLTARQVRILRAVIEEFIETAQPVGSDTLDKKYSIGVSPATIRNEMVYLTKQGYLSKGHTSSGRLPTSLALKLYVNELMKEKELSVADEVSAKERVWNNREEGGELLHQLAMVLAEKTRALGLAMTEDRHVYHAGYANLLNMPEFFDIDVVRNVLSLIEEPPLLEEIFDSVHSEGQIQLVFGQDLGNRHLESVGVVFLRVRSPRLQCVMGALGSMRFHYDYVVPMMRHLRGVVEELVQ